MKNEKSEQRAKVSKRKELTDEDRIELEVRGKPQR